VRVRLPLSARGRSSPPFLQGEGAGVEVLSVVRFLKIKLRLNHVSSFLISHVLAV